MRNGSIGVTEWVPVSYQQHFVLFCRVPIVLYVCVSFSVYDNGVYFMFPSQKNFMCFLNRATEKQKHCFAVDGKSAKIGQSQNYALLETCELKNLLALNNRRVFSCF